jgi:hypothetical protein
VNGGHRPKKRGPGDGSAGEYQKANFNVCFLHSAGYSASGLVIGNRKKHRVTIWNDKGYVMAKMEGNRSCIQLV